MPIHVLRRREFSLRTSALLPTAVLSVALISGAVLVATAARAQAPLGCPSDHERQVLAATNAIRSSGTICNGVFFPPVPALGLDVRLSEAAQLHSDDMAMQGFFGHTGSDGSNAGQRMNAAGYAWWGWGENIAAGYSTPESAVSAWHTSTSGHCENMMNANHRHLGVGHIELGGSPYRHYWTQVFGRPASGEVRLGPETECPACSDTLDNDLDGFIDAPDDLQCVDGFDDRENPSPPPASCGLGPEILPAIAFVAWARRRRFARAPSA